LSDPDWLVWAREIQAIAQTGLAFTKDPYDVERYHALRALSVRIMAAHTGLDSAVIADLFAGDSGYATPKLGVRAAVFDEQGRVLLVREAIDDNRWTLPGGWAEVNQTPAESVVREVFEESGYHVRPVKLAAVWDRVRQGHPAGSASVVKLAFTCALEGGAPATSLETSGCGWFAEDEIPADLSIRRTLPHQIARLFAHWRYPSMPTDFD
jgi:ADP-ribose pyrophosphatase YjhB (NUDIX family)